MAEEATRDLWSERAGLQLFYHALAGRSAVIAAEEDRAFGADEDQRLIRLPAGAAKQWCLVALAHRALHQELGTSTVDLSRLGSTFDDRGLFLELFELLEDFRIDESLARRFAGLAVALRDEQAQELTMRPPLERLALRSAIVELLARESLGRRADAPADLAPIARELATIVDRLRGPGAMVEDSVEAAVAAMAVVRAALRDAHALAWETDARVEAPLVPVAYRDRIDAAVRHGGPVDEAEDEPERDAIVARASGSSDGLAPRTARPQGYEVRVPARTDDGPLAPEPGSWLYPEWDHRAGLYRERWARVRESVPTSSGVAEAYRDALRERRELVMDIRRQFERIAPQTLRRVKGLRDGEDLNVDAAIDALADLRAGVPPSEDLYITRRRTQRDVAVVFLVDLSGSTQDPVNTARGYRRIFEVEREGLILLIEPLLRLGDLFGLYGFSGANREDVRVVVLKDLHEPMTNRVLSRLDGIAPMHTTRMGAVVRHAATKLKGVTATTRLLMLISDGRPFDVDYGQRYGDGAELDYAVHDTRAALDEVRARGIRPFLLTVDSRGADYLRTMCRDLDYEVLRDVSELPARLAALYGKLTARAPVTA